MYLLPGNPSLHAMEGYRDSGEGRCAKCMHTVPPSFRSGTTHTRTHRDMCHPTSDQVLKMPVSAFSGSLS